jgi:hypothetical protein
MIKSAWRKRGGVEMLPRFPRSPFLDYEDEKLRGLRDYFRIVDDSSLRTC